MEFKIGFCTENTSTEENKTQTLSANCKEPKKSLVQVRFENSKICLTYFNDKFDLKIGDIVFVDGQYKGIRGYIENINYNFKIKPSQYKRVIAVANTNINGELEFLGEDYFLSFDKTVIPSEKIERWFLPPDDEEYVCGYDEKSYQLTNQQTLDANPTIADRGFGYFINGNVAYLCLDGSKGSAIVLGEKPYKTEFTFYNGEISRLSCTCPCGYTCKHLVATSFLLDDLLNEINVFGERFSKTDYFAAINKDLLYKIAIKNITLGKIIL